MGESVHQILAAHAIAGAASATLGSAVTYPLDTVKTLLQVGSNSNKKLNYLQVLDILRSCSGISGLYSGFGWSAAGRILGLGARFGAYEVLSAFCKDGRRSGFLRESEAFMAGMAAGMAENVISSPFELLKLRAQVSAASRIAKSFSSTENRAGSPLITKLLPGYSPSVKELNRSVALLSCLSKNYQNLVQSLQEYPWMITGSGKPPSPWDVKSPSRIFSLEGAGTFWKGLRSGIARDSIFGGVFFCSWHTIHEILVNIKAVKMRPIPRTNDDVTLSPLTISLTAAFCGTIAAAASHCFDTSRSRSQCVVLPKYVTFERKLMKWKEPGNWIMRNVGIHPADSGVLLCGILPRMARSGLSSLLVVGGYYLAVGSLIPS